VYIDGSYTTDKPNPSDIDIVFEVDDKAPAETLSPLLVEISNKEKVMSQYGVHPFAQIPILKNHNNMPAFFQHLKEQDALSRGIKVLPKTAQKGIVRITL